MKTTDSSRARQLTAAGALAVVVCLCLPQPAFSSFKHVRLLRSEPAADSTVQAVPTAIRFWFSGPVQIPVMTVRMSDSASHVVEVAKARLGEGPNTPVIADVKGAMTPGRHTVVWRTMSRDGHVVSGRFTFVLAAPPTHGH